ncbi:ornithine cyclodeaminase family protein [Phycisphaera mikurensis]|uniref:Putative ornithine cyclodeaminase n=1 Tax=Phycisphaera mikurensis (strain NBRC 102666 / KCTC 22515 / FYK2301M01) TaxID=1142394 RepID=I0ICU8_PHYMF|nr:putative ornithine cyclodeaminase [Phycisphaera mikurensis]MBB6443297.1 ornithine cyclodeaminase [Phycisphaera mikurensis]BAM03086.1 putative ornithine cyclodeaminase [Phycisphaera mikurensis NBRC 102666]
MAHAAPTATPAAGGAPRVLGFDAIAALLEGLPLVDAMEAGFVAYSRGDANVPPVGELLLPGGECHIKHGTIRGHPHYVVKVASGFPGNPALGLPAANGLMLLFDASTGAAVAVLLDRGLLTDARTAAAGALAARLLAPDRPDGSGAIGIVGTGAQARFQARWLLGVTSERRLRCWGRSAAKAQRLAEELRGIGFDAAASPDLGEMMAASSLVVTTTNAEDPLILPEHLHPGLHVTAIGSDAAHKQELHAGVLAEADAVVVDSRAQAALRGEVHRAVAAGTLSMERVVEIGEVAAGTRPGRIDERSVTVADLTGLAVQDLQIASAVVSADRAAQEPPP